MATEPRRVIKKVANARLFNDNTLLIQNVRASYPHVFNLYAVKPTDTPAFSIVGLMPKTTHLEAKDLCVEVINGLLREKKVERLPADKKFIRNGDEAAKVGYDGTWYVASRETKRPLVLGLDGKTRLDPVRDADKIFGGCWVNMLIRPWYQNNEWGKRVNAGLVAVQYVRADEAFGEGHISQEDAASSFDNVGGDDSGFDDGLGGADDDNGGL